MKIKHAVSQMNLYYYYAGRKKQKLMKIIRYIALK